jgi:hypothetical protein
VEAQITTGTGNSVLSASSPVSTGSITVTAGQILIVGTMTVSGTVTAITMNGANADTTSFSGADDAGVNTVQGFVWKSPATGVLTITFTGGVEVAAWYQLWNGVGTGGLGSTWRTPPTLTKGDGSGTGTTATITATTVSGDVVVDTMSTYNQAPTVNGSQTQLLNTNPFGNGKYIGVSYKAATTTSTTMTWTFTGTYWAQGAIILIPAAGGGGGGSSTPGNGSVKKKKQCLILKTCNVNEKN